PERAGPGQRGAAADRAPTGEGLATVVMSAERVEIAGAGRTAAAAGSRVERDPVVQVAPGGGHGAAREPAVPVAGPDQFGERGTRTVGRPPVIEICSAV